VRQITVCARLTESSPAVALPNWTALTRSRFPANASLRRRACWSESNAAGSGEEYGHCRSETPVAHHRDVAAAADEMQMATSDELRSLSEQGQAIEPVVTAGHDEGRRGDRHRAAGQIKAVLSLDNGRHVCPLPRTAHQPADEQP